MGPDDKPPPYAPGTYVGPPAPGGYAPPPPRTYQGGAFIPPTDGQYHHQAPYPPYPGAYPPAGPPPPGMARCLKPLNQPSRPLINSPDLHLALQASNLLFKLQACSTDLRSPLQAKNQPYRFQIWLQKSQLVFLGLLYSPSRCLETFLL